MATDGGADADVRDRKTVFLLGPASLLLAICSTSAWADEYRQRCALIQKRDSAKRRAPVIPPKDRKLRVIIDSDTGAEMDDVWAIALALRRPERFQIEGLVAANFDEPSRDGGPGSVEGSAGLMETVAKGRDCRGRFRSSAVPRRCVAILSHPSPRAWTSSSKWRWLRRQGIRSGSSAWARRRTSRRPI